MQCNATNPLTASDAYRPCNPLFSSPHLCFYSAGSLQPEDTAVVAFHFLIFSSLPFCAYCELSVCCKQMRRCSWTELLPAANIRLNCCKASIQM